MRKIGDHAVVLGAGMAGLLATRVLADAYERVTVVERDRLPETAENRKGVPQGRHAHLLVPQGTHILDELVPGLLATMILVAIHINFEFIFMDFILHYLFAITAGMLVAILAGARNRAKTSASAHLRPATASAG